MSTPDEPSTPSLTRRQLREIRNTGATPVVPATPPASEPAPAPLPRPAAPAQVAPAPLPDASVDLGVSPLTRRQAREQERIRTASIPVISADVADATAAAPPAVVSDDENAPAPATEADSSAQELLGLEAEPEEQDAAPVAPATVSEALGSGLLAGEVPAAELPPSFDQLLSRETATAGAVTTPNALILSQTPSAPLVGPVTATGEVIITGTFDLPAGLGSTGHVPGTTDGLDADAVLIDGELPPASSPTPIAASAAISTVKSADEIIRPPAPEKGSKLMLALAITAGALALALIGVLVLAVTTGVFS